MRLRFSGLTPVLVGALSLLACGKSATGEGKNAIGGSDSASAVDGSAPGGAGIDGTRDSVGGATNSGGTVAPGGGATNSGGTAAPGGGATNSGGTAAPGGGATNSGGSNAQGGAATNVSGTDPQGGAGGSSVTSTARQGGSSNRGGSPSSSSSSGTANATGATEVGRVAWDDYGVVEDAPPVSFFVGAWTNTFASSGDKGNDYPFVIPCTNDDYLILVSGNNGWDGVAGTWVYNANTMTWTGDHAVVYEKTTEALAHGWVYAGWHFQRVGSRTITTEYLKFGESGAMQQVIQESEDRIYTPTGVHFGGDDRNWSKFYMQYARIYAMDAPPSVAEVDAIAMRTTPDANAWGDWPMTGASTRDVSGNGRDIMVIGNWYPGIPSPAL